MKNHFSGYQFIWNNILIFVFLSCWWLPYDMILSVNRLRWRKSCEMENIMHCFALISNKARWNQWQESKSNHFMKGKKEKRKQTNKSVKYRKWLKNDISIILNYTCIDISIYCNVANVLLTQTMPLTFSVHKFFT